MSLLQWSSCKSLVSLLLSPALWWGRGGREEPQPVRCYVLTDSCPWHHFLSATRPKQCWSWGYAEIYCPVPFAPYPFLIVQLHLWHSSISLPSLAITNLSLTPLVPCLWWHPSWDSACASLQLLSLPPLTSWLKFPSPKPFYKKFKSWHVTMSESQYFLCPRNVMEKNTFSYSLP